MPEMRITSRSTSKRSTYESMIRSRNAELGAAVAAIAEERWPATMLGDDESRLVIALTLLAAGLPMDVVATPESALRDALEVVQEFSGVEFYLLQNGVAVKHFHALRERLGTDFSAA